MFFIDESGIIPKQCPDPHNEREHYFVIAFIQTENPQKLKTVYRRILRTMRKYYPTFFDNQVSHLEVKGSNLPAFMKEYILKELIQKTDIKIAHMVVDNRKIVDRFRMDVTRSFNYLIKLILENIPLYVSERECLQLFVDNRNTAIHSLSELEGYLFNELVLDKAITSDVHVNYMDSKNNVGIQIADIFANLFYQRYRYIERDFPRYSETSTIKQRAKIHPYSAEYIYQFLLDSGRLVTPYIHPYSEIHQKEFVDCV